MFVGLHIMLAERTQTPELRMTLEEGQTFMGAAQNVMRHYSVQSTQKTMDWIAFMGVGAGIYMPRVGAYMARRNHEKRAPEQHMNEAAPIITPAAQEVN